MNSRNTHRIEKPSPSDGEVSDRDDSDDPLKQLQGALALAKSGVVAGSTQVEAMHLAISSHWFAALDVVPVVSVASRGIRPLHDGITRSVHRLIRGTATLVLDTATLGIERAADMRTTQRGS